jgi:hypothetical protein
VGLLLTFGNYYSGLTWTFVLLFFAFVATLVLLYRYRQSIFEELHEFVGSKASIFIGAFLIAVSAAFVPKYANEERRLCLGHES